MKKGETVDARNLVYYSLINAEKTQTYANQLMSLKDQLPQGWNGIIAPDSSCPYFLLCNFRGEETATLHNLNYQGWSPVFHEITYISKEGATATFCATQNHSIAHALPVMVRGKHVTAQLMKGEGIKITATAKTTVTVAFFQKEGKTSVQTCRMKKGQTLTLPL